ncbi:MAG: hypothetical protein ACYTHN_18810 [Planctomycetota bacterium]
MQSEWATDVLFDDPNHLAAIYRPLVRHGITGLSSGDVMRFLGGKVHGCFGGQIVSDFKNRPEGIRIKHRVNHNSVKLYDKQGTILRVETTVNQPSGFKVFRHKQGDPHGEKTWRKMRQGIADLPRRAEVSKKANRGEFCINGFRNKDLRPLLFDPRPSGPVEARRFSRRVTRVIRLLRAHRLVRKIPRSHRYKTTPRAHEIASLLLATRELTSEQINHLAA